MPLLHETNGTPSFLTSLIKTYVREVMEFQRTITAIPMEAGLRRHSPRAKLVLPFCVLTLSRDLDNSYIQYAQTHTHTHGAHIISDTVSVPSNSFSLIKRTSHWDALNLLKLLL